MLAFLVFLASTDTETKVNKLGNINVLQIKEAKKVIINGRRRNLWRLRVLKNQVGHENQRMKERSPEYILLGREQH